MGSHEEMVSGNCRIGKAYYLGLEGVHMPKRGASGTGTGREFMEKTKYRFLGPSAQERGLPQPPLEIPPVPGKTIIDLPEPASLKIPLIDLRAAIEHRRSIRAYLREPLTRAELAFLLWCSQGVQRVAGTSATFRTVPSAGARHAMETYLLINDVSGIPAGLYRYLALTHQIQETDMDPTLPVRVMEASLRQQFILRAGVIFIWVAVPYRMTWRYGERGYRELHKDAGHICQNLYLAAEAIGCGVCAIAAYDDDLMDAILGIDGVERFAIYLATVGKVRERSELEE